MGFRILHSISSVNPAGGGPIEGLKQLAAINIEHGHRVEVISLDDPASPWVKDCPVRCHAMGPSSSIYHYSPRFVPWLREHRHEYDVVIVNGLWQYTSFGVWRALRDTPTPYFVFTHGMLDPWFKRRYPMKHLKKWLYWPWAEYRVLRDATAVLFTCEEERRLARQSFWLYKCDEFVVNYGTSAPTGDPQAQRALFLERFPHLRDKRCLLFLGRVHEKKGPDLLFRAFAALLTRLASDQRRDLHLVMAGPDDHAFGREMKALVASLGLTERVTWTGMVSGDLKWGAFHASDAFVLTSHQENFGIAVVEALACGVPVLISSQVNIWREIRQAGAGFVDSDDPAGAERLLEQWVGADAALWQRMRGAARKVFSERFVIDGTAESFIRAMRLYGLRSSAA
jgi:glycosyltransferase involved in cell wall biosynthesis